MQTWTICVLISYKENNSYNCNKLTVQQIPWYNYKRSIMNRSFKVYKDFESVLMQGMLYNVLIITYIKLHKVLFIYEKLGYV